MNEKDEYIFILDNIAIPTNSMLEATEYYPMYVRHGGKRAYQEYILLVERKIDGRTKTAFSEFIKDHFAAFLVMAQFSNEHWRRAEEEEALRHN